MNPVDITSLRRTLELTASTGAATSVVALQALRPIFEQIPEDLIICIGCNLGVAPGIQICPRCQTAFTTVHSKVQKMVDGNMCAVVTDAAVFCVDSQDDGVEGAVDNLRIWRGTFRLNASLPGLLNQTF